MLFYLSYLIYLFTCISGMYNILMYIILYMIVLYLIQIAILHIAY